MGAWLRGPWELLLRHFPTALFLRFPAKAGPCVQKRIVEDGVPVAVPLASHGTVRGLEPLSDLAPPAANGQPGTTDHR
jgi:hypothetical protein